MRTYSLLSTSCPLFVLALAGFLPAAQADPILLTATSATYAAGPQFTSGTVSGPGFTLSESVRGGIGIVNVAPGSELYALARIAGSQKQPQTDFDTQIIGSIQVGEVARDALFEGSASTPPGRITLSKNPDEISTAPSLPLTITGSFSGCLADPAFHLQCDPNYLNYATVQVALAGTFTFNLGTPNNYIFRLFSENYLATTPVPEPASLGLLTLVFLTWIAIRNPLRQRRLGEHFGTAFAQVNTSKRSGCISAAASASRAFRRLRLLL